MLKSNVKCTFQLCPKDRGKKANIIVFCTYSYNDGISKIYLQSVNNSTVFERMQKS